MQGVFLETESFKELGGWVIEQQSTLQMGSPYIMAHGLGVPVSDALTEFFLEEDGEYIVWVRTRDWTAPWGNLQAGKFRIGIDGTLFQGVLGTNGKEWNWQNAGGRYLTKGKHTVFLHDCTGFNGRADAIYISKNGDVPPNEKNELEKFRCAYVCPQEKHIDKVYDLIVVGGGIAGICTAIAAMRSGEKVLLVHDREILGGCNSSEVRVCLGGQIHIPPYSNLGNVVKEIQPIMGAPWLYDEKLYEDSRKRLVFDIAETLHDCELALGEIAVSVHMQQEKIYALETLCVRTGMRKVYIGNRFADCTGDAVVARMAGAQTMYGREDKQAFGESLGAETYEKMVMGHSIRWYSKATESESLFPDFNTGMFHSEEDCLHVLNGDWEQETGFRRDMAEETEYIRDYGLYVIFGNWSYQKNQSVRKEEYAKRELAWVSYLGGKRESYRVVGDYVLTQRDIEERIPHKDGTASLSWEIDLHFPETENEEKFGEAFRSFAYHRGIGEPYPVPYRCLYAKDVSNLFLGGRTVSVSHVAFASVRVMRTLGMLGEVVGLASAICNKYACTPREVYASHLDELKERMKKGVETPNAFACGGGTLERYHFKDAGWIDCRELEKIETSPYAKKVKKNIKKLCLLHKTKNDKA